MAGLGQRLDVHFNNPNLPKYRQDAIMGDGALVLIDHAFSTDPLIGQPVNGMMMKNHAWQNAAALAGGGTESQWELQLAVNIQSEDGFIDRSTKGGVNICMSQATQTGTSKGALIRPSSTSHPLLQYIYDNLDHNYFFAKLELTTRVAKTASVEPTEATCYKSGHSSPYTQLLYNFNRTTTVNATLGAYSDPSLPQIAGATLRCGGFGGWTVAGRPTSAAEILISMLAIGQTPSAYSAIPTNISRSCVHYWSYFEDMTAGASNFEDARDRAIAKMNRDLAPGGRLYGDTYTPLIP